MASDPLVGKILADRFEILERIGEGGTGVVYKAKQLTVDRVIAIKVLGAHVSTDPQWVKRFHNEARAAAKLDHPNTQQARAGVVFGTPCYMSPEQGRGAQLGPASDIYAFGVCLYEMLSGKPPFDSKIPTEVVMMHMRQAPPPLSGLPAQV